MENRDWEILRRLMPGALNMDSETIPDKRMPLPEAVSKTGAAGNDHPPEHHAYPRRSRNLRTWPPVPRAKSRLDHFQHGRDFHRAHPGPSGPGQKIHHHLLRQTHIPRPRPTPSSSAGWTRENSKLRTGASSPSRSGSWPGPWASPISRSGRLSARTWPKTTRTGLSPNPTVCTAGSRLSGPTSLSFTPSPRILPATPSSPRPTARMPGDRGPARKASCSPASRLCRRN